jgi:hypothetical protein
MLSKKWMNFWGMLELALTYFRESHGGEEERVELNDIFMEAFYIPLSDMTQFKLFVEIIGQIQFGTHKLM